MSTRQFTITAFYLFILVLTSLAALVEVGLADVVTNADLDEPPPVPTFTPSPRSDYEANSQSENPTDMALIILANKIDSLEDKIQELNKATKFARQLDENKKTIMSIMTAIIIFAAFGVSELIEFIKIKLGL